MKGRSRVVVRPEPAPVIFTTFRSLCGQARITARGDYSLRYPWHVYMKGTASRTFARASEAAHYLRGFGYVVTL